MLPILPLPCPPSTLGRLQPSITGNHQPAAVIRQSHSTPQRLARMAGCSAQSSSEFTPERGLRLRLFPQARSGSRHPGMGSAAPSICGATRLPRTGIASSIISFSRSGCPYHDSGLVVGRLPEMTRGNWQTANSLELICRCVQCAGDPCISRIPETKKPASAGFFPLQPDGQATPVVRVSC